MMLSSLGGATLGGLLLMGSSQNTEGPPVTSGTYRGLTVTVKSVERATRVNLQDCPPGANAVRGVIRPTEENEFVTVDIDVQVRDTFASADVPKPVLYDAAGTVYKTAQSFGEVGPETSFTCNFSFRLPKGTKVSRFGIGEVSLDLTSLDK